MSTWRALQQSKKLHNWGINQNQFCSVNWAHSEGQPHTEGTFTGNLVNVGSLRQHSGECQEGSRAKGAVGSPKLPNFARLRQSSHEGARMLPVHLEPA